MKPRIKIIKDNRTGCNTDMYRLESIGIVNNIQIKCVMWTYPNIDKDYIEPIEANFFEKINKYWVNL